jgi:magnesium transporter
VALPVTDSNGVLLGIVTHDDVLDVVQEEATEDIQKIGAVGPLEDPYMDVRFIEMVKKRARWLIILFVGEMLTATAMGFFESEIARAVVLATSFPSSSPAEATADHRQQPSSSAPWRWGRSRSAPGGR